MIDTTNVHTLPARRRDDTGDTARSTPAFAVPVPLPFDNDESFADALIAQGRAEAARRAALAIARNVQARIESDKLRQRELAEARRLAFEQGAASRKQIHRRQLALAVGISLLMGGGAVALLVKLGIHVARLT